MKPEQNLGSGYCAYDAEWKEVIRELAATNRRRFDASREGASGAANSTVRQ